MRPFLLAVTCLMVLPQAVRAASPPCTVEQATNQIEADDIQRHGRAAQVTIPMLDELKAIVAKAPDPHRAIGDQLAPRDAARFAEISQRMQQMRLSAYVESAHARDANVAEQMLVAARKSYADVAYMPSDNDVPGSILVVMRVVLPEQMPRLPPTGASCTVELAISGQEQAGLRRIHALTTMLHRDGLVVRRLRARYGVDQDGKLDPSKMDPEDARTLETLQVEMQPAFRERTLSLDLQHIRAWWAAADLVYRTRMEDVATYASAEHIGDTLQQQANGLSREQRVLIGLWQKVDERV